METTEARQAIIAALEAAQVTMEARHVPTTYNPNAGKDDWQHIAWSIVFRSPRGEFTTSYRQGIGHLPEDLRPKSWERVTIHQAQRIAWALKTGRNPDRRADHFHTGTPSKPLAPPDIADVVSSLVMDASAADYSSFAEWARDMGGNPDSIKELETFNACQRIALDLLRVFGPQTMEAIKEPAQSL
jgi:hypothetical protein